MKHKDDNSEIPAGWLEGSVHSAYVRILIAHIEQSGQSRRHQRPLAERMLPLLDIIPLLDELDVQRHPDIGTTIGNSIPAAAHGAMGYAAVSSATVGDAMSTIARYTLMRNRLFDYRCVVSDGATVLSLAPRLPMGNYRPFLEIATFVTLFKMVQLLAGDAATRHLEVEVSWPQQPGESSLPAHTRYSRPLSLMRVPGAIASQRTPTEDSKLYAMACRSCEEELAVLSGHAAARVRSLLLPRPQQPWPTLNEVARQMAVSRSTLIRHLADEGFSYQVLLDEARRELACWYLRKTALPLSGIAERLGYADSSNFSRSFRRWQDMAPLQYRHSWQHADSEESVS